LILEYSNWLRINRSLGWKEAVHQGARSKFRAVMMTNIASITAMIPLALGFSEGAELRQPMAVASVGGLLISALMTLFLIPAYYWALPSIASKLRNRLSRKRAKA